MSWFRRNGSPVRAAMLIGAMAVLPPTARAQTQNPQLGAEAQAANRQAGFDDGCDTARSSRIAPVKHRDEAAYAASDSYRSGWRQGYNTCQRQNDNTPERLLGSPFGGR